MFPLETAPPPQPPYTSWRPESRLGFSAADEARSRPEVGSRLIPGPGPSLPQLSSEPEQVLFTFFSLLIQGVPYHWAHFVFVIFSASGACTEELFIAIG